MGTRVQHSLTKSLQRARESLARELDVSVDCVVITSPTSIKSDLTILEFRVIVDLDELCREASDD